MGQYSYSVFFFFFFLAPMRSSRHTCESDRSIDGLINVF